MELEFRLLGPVEAWHGDRPLRLGGPKPRALLAVLLLRAGQVVPADALVDVIWGDEPPDTARALVQTYVSALRRALPAEVAEAIETRPPGYVMRPGVGRVDVAEFEARTADGRRAAADGHHTEAALLLRQALQLWHGPALGGVGDALRGEAGRLEEARQATLEERIAAELEAGGHEAELVTELTALVGARPTRERPRGQLMLGLYRLGRQADALAVYAQGRAVLAEELGLDPGPELNRLYEAILRADPTLLASTTTTAAPQPAAAPRPVSLLPPAIGDFTGREEELARVVAGLTGAREAMPVVVVSGAAGVGKSALAVQAAHRVAGEYPDGQLYAELHGFSEPVPPAEVLGRLLRALGADPPEDTAERGDLFRSLVAGRRILLVLDDANGEAQVRPLLPGSATCGVLVTSRARLGGLVGARRTDLDVLDDVRGLELLTRVTGPERTPDDPREQAAARRIVELCGGLPLALRIAGARLATRRHWTPSVLAERLADEHRRLDELSVGDLEVRAGLGLSYQALDECARRVLRRIAALGSADVAVWTVAALSGMPEDEAEENLERLLDAQLINCPGTDQVGQPRYRLHDLVRVYAAERAEAEDPVGDRTAAVGRALTAGLWLMDRVTEAAPSGAVILRQGFRRAPLKGRGELPEQPRTTGSREAAEHTSPVGEQTARRALEDPFAWFDAEADTLTNAVERAAAMGLHTLACEAAAALCSSSFAIKNRFDAWWRSHDAALAAARRAEDRSGEALLIIGLGQLRYEQDRIAESQEYFRTAERICTELGDVRGRSAALAGLGSACREVGELRDAERALTDAADGFRRVGDDTGVGVACRYGGSVRLELGDQKGAFPLLDESLRAYRRLGSRRGEALALRTLSLVHRSLDAYEEAARVAEQALEILRALGDPHMAAYALRARAKARLRLGHTREAEAELHEILEVCRVHEDRFGEALTLRTLGECALADGRLADAEGLLTASAALWGVLALPLPRARALRNLSVVRAALGDQAGADALRAEAMEVFNACEARERHEPWPWV
ncbi:MULTISPECIES: AfsR/SARP family transcriptional regulator [Streptomyces]|uniref:AfsR/SARP family transcriptional regulator n=1 Tax=Streptomyces TaxID=1883 RepID=UPI000A385E88|nr:MULTISPECIES: AfsR/SARP family transcriptional regulator [Streptomyces]MDX3580543.1 BTAD domain-containing putative transcriptional regulator [Streptomyces europaeiscabiei]MDX3615526.1 BTAD domain-containing putative transcriptional regulator [Streptomyces europaeiscabiei]MDX3631478.1 BTAD domain-containing putative transcriptional regulator [Streptomyces europaeiscabiei]MDX3647958.1 BTAD domain-containing putative transcriptional regulator [Streptomyces europaeiscabiei]